MPLTYTARRRLSLLILIVGLPVYIAAAIFVMALLDDNYGRLPALVEFLVYVVLGVVWILPFRFVFRGVGQPDPDAVTARVSEPASEQARGTSAGPADPSG